MPGDSNDERVFEDAVDLQSLDFYTIQEIERLIHGFPETDARPHELDEYMEGKHGGLSAVVGLLTRLESEIEDDKPSDDVVEE